MIETWADVMPVLSQVDTQAFRQRVCDLARD
jgi:hypothetical protein